MLDYFRTKDGRMVVQVCISLRACYAVSGTELAYGATGCYYGGSEPHSLFRRRVGSAISLRPSYAMSGADIAYGATTRLLRDVRYWHSVWCFCASATRCPVLPYGVRCYRPTRATRCPDDRDHLLRVLLVRLLLRFLSPYAPPTPSPRIMLCACYAMSGTELGYVGTAMLARRNVRY
eukprot:1130297-Rhodomonas_salina.5